VCEPCRAIAEGRHVDVLEMDAASRTGVGDIREIIDSVAYRAASARYKIYIIDEVHMLSTNAFNALLKTLEEPPAHVKFIFATTEIRKVPVTVLSRCQRFDLRRIEPETMVAHLGRIAMAEGVTLHADACALIARAAEGSVRDALSLLDQAIVHGAGEVGAETVRAMLGLADRGRVLDLFELVMKGDAAGALAELGAQYADGADPFAVLRDLAETTHWISVLKITPGAADDPTIAPDERARGLDFAARLPMRALTRAWQMLIKAIEETALAPNPMAGAEMALIRLTHVADLPDPESLLRRLGGIAPGGGGAAPAPSGGTPSGGAPSGGARAMATAAEAMGGGRAAGPVASGNAAPARAEAPSALLARFEDVVALIRARRDLTLLVDVETGVRLVRHAPGRIEFEPAPGAPADLAARLSRRLQEWTGSRWGVSIVSEGGAPTIAEMAARARDGAEAEAMDHPVVQAVLAAFPGARIAAVRDLAPEAAEGPAAPDDAAMIDDDWDPFEES
jgi:DNA polymerase-3 subunit gamma/tau